MDELFSHRGEIFGTCGEEQKAVLQVNCIYLPCLSCLNGGESVQL